MTPVTNRVDIPLIPTPRLVRADGSAAVLVAIGCIGEGAAAAACDASGRLMRLVRRDLEACAGLRWRADRGDAGWCATRGRPSPVAHIEDAPVPPVRGYYLDVTRGRVPTLSSLKALVDTLELHKYNQLARRWRTRGGSPAASPNCGV
ncbi:hypothetical protein H6A11_06825 [Bifidobacterium pullorum subsp. saeculare]|uniref:hypothetical protein n=1 Tax=Bifidobacterium pullorum TaxID=78448 RepID=UPI00195D6889|nr:hypothetical protein [Bifidobacterium pullorum]MBM6696737.1 hypothetical protein [Bifidobacterium pullorum subsp. saeculare]